MNFTADHELGSTRMAKAAIVAALHVAVALAVIHSMDTVNMPRTIKEVITTFVPEEIKPIEPPPPVEKFTPTKPDTTIVVPETEVVIEKTTPPVVTAVVDPGPPREAGPKVPTGDQVAQADPNVMHTAVFADANGCVKPAYPARAARNGDSGTTSLALLVGVDGKVARAKVQHSSGSKDLDRAAVEALSLCKFKPATSGGVAEQGWAQLAYVWTLE